LIKPVASNKKTPTENQENNPEDQIKIAGEKIQFEPGPDDFLPKRVPSEPQADRESMMEIESESLLAKSSPNLLTKKFAKQRVSAGPETIKNFEVGFKQPTPMQLEWFKQIEAEAAEENKEQELGDTVFNAKVKPLPVKRTTRKTKSKSTRSSGSDDETPKQKKTTPKTTPRKKKTAPKESPQSVLALSKSLPQIMSPPKSTPRVTRGRAKPASQIPSLQFTTIGMDIENATPVKTASHTPVVTPKSTPRNKTKINFV